jgi:glycerate kinase
MAFAGARLESGFELFARRAKLEQRLRRADLVITGEGRIDSSALMGKGVGQIAESCCELNRPCLALAGDVTDEPAVRAAFWQVRALTELTTPTKAKAKSAYWLERLAEGASTAVGARAVLKTPHSKRSTGFVPPRRSR